MRFSFIVVLIFCFVVKNKAQNKDSLHSVEKELIESKVQEVIERNNYVRVPVKEFEESIDHKISNALDKRLSTLVGFLVAVIGILSTLSIIQSNRSKNLLKEQFLIQIEKETNKKIGELRDFYERLIESRLKELEKQLLEKFELKLKNGLENVDNVEKQLQQSNSQMNRAEGYMLNLELENLREKIMSRKYTYEMTLQRAKDFLKTAEDKNKNELLPEIINLLTYVYYDYRKYNEVTNLLDKYEGKVKLISTSYINAALTAISDYHNYNSFSQRERALDYLNKSLELTQGYGQAQGLKLEIFMMDYLRAEDENVKTEAIENANYVINDILKSESNAPASETINRLNADVGFQPYKKYVDLLYELFPDDLKLIHKKEQEYNDYLTTQK